MIKAAIFDLDGVLIDTEPLWFETYQQVSAEFGFTFTEEMDKLVKGRSNGVTRITSIFGIPGKQRQFAEKTREVYKDLFRRKAKLMPGAVKLLDKLKGKYRLALATSAYKYRLKFNLEKFAQLKSFFEVITSGDEVKNGKPSPDIFILTANKLGVEPKECLVIEDAESGVKAAIAARMKVVGLLPGHTTPQDLSRADKVVGSLLEVDLNSF